MQIKITKKTTFTTILVVFFVFIDKLFKVLSIKGYLDDPRYVWGDIFSLHFIANENIAFSLPFSGPVLNFFVGIIILCLLVWWIKLYKQITVNKTKNDIIYSLTILIFGAILNFTDRIKFGYVIDYFDLKYFTVFNIADIMISASVLCLVLIIIKNKNYV